MIVIVVVVVVAAAAGYLLLHRRRRAARRDEQLAAGDAVAVTNPAFEQPGGPEHASTAGAVPPQHDYEEALSKYAKALESTDEPELRKAIFFNCSLANARLHDQSTHRRRRQVGDAAGTVGRRVQRTRARDGRCGEQQHVNENNLANEYMRYQKTFEELQAGRGRRQCSISLACATAIHTFPAKRTTSMSVADNIIGYEADYFKSKHTPNGRKAKKKQKSEREKHTGSIRMC